MSLESGEQLPLPSEPRCIAVVPGMHTAWTALVLLSGEVCSGKSELQRNAGPMLLAFRYLQKAMVEAMKDTSGENKTELANTAKDVVRAGQWFQPQVEDLLDGQDSLTVSIHVAQAELNQLSSPNPAKAVGILMDGRFRLAHCQLVWDLIKLYTEGIPSAMKAIKADQLKGALKRLKAVTDKYSSLPSEEGTYQPSRRSRDPGNRPTQGHDAIKAMVGPREKDNERLRRFTEGLAPKEGLVSAPGWIPAVSIATLTHADWVDDRVIDGYLALVCHHGNGHFKALKEGNSSEREGSPRFHAWPVFLSHGVIGFGSNWPPPYYPSARI